MTENNDLLNKWSLIIESHNDCLTKFIASCHSICEEYIKSKKIDLVEKFNVFTIISDLYYKENFHSDIMKYFLDPKEKHNCGNKLLEVFIRMLNDAGRSINTKFYDDAIVIREEGKIDILIKSESSKRAIIIENKINNAVDMPRQLPRYYDYISPHYTIDAIVYLPLDRTKQPDMSDWSEDDKNSVCSLLEIVPAYDKSQRINIVNNWLLPSLMVATSPDVLSFLRQYSELIRKLNTNIMDSIILEKFYQELLQEDNLKSALSIRSMLNDLPNYLSLRIQDKFGGRCYPFSKIWIYSSHDTVFEGAIVSNIYLKMDVWCYENGYDLLFWSPEDHNASVEDFDNLIGQIDPLKDFEKKADTQNQVYKHFDFKDEPGLYGCINSILVSLTAMKKNERV